MSNDWIMLVKDLSLAHPPSEKGRKFYMSTSAASPSPSATSLNSNNNVNLKVNSKSTFQKLKLIAADLRGRFLYFLILYYCWFEISYSRNT